MDPTSARSKRQRTVSYRPYASVRVDGKFVVTLYVRTFYVPRGNRLCRTGHMPGFESMVSAFLLCTCGHLYACVCSKRLRMCRTGHVTWSDSMVAFYLMNVLVHAFLSLYVHKRICYCLCVCSTRQQQAVPTDQVPLFKWMVSFYFSLLCTQTYALYSHVCMRLYTCIIHTYIHASVRTYITQTYIHKLQANAPHTYIHTYTHTHTHTSPANTGTESKSQRKIKQKGDAELRQMASSLVDQLKEMNVQSALNGWCCCCLCFNTMYMHMHMCIYIYIYCPPLSTNGKK
jgi:hypothetical protein